MIILLIKLLKDICLLKTFLVFNLLHILIWQIHFFINYLQLGIKISVSLEKEALGTGKNLLSFTLQYCKLSSLIHVYDVSTILNKYD